MSVYVSLCVHQGQVAKVPLESDLNRYHVAALKTPFAEDAGLCWLFRRDREGEREGGADRTLDAAAECVVAGERLFW